MNSFDLFLHHHLSAVGWTVEVLFRLLLAGLAGAMVGGER
jgi:hypothetical protein